MFGTPWGISPSFIHWCYSAIVRQILLYGVVDRFVAALRITGALRTIPTTAYGPLCWTLRGKSLKSLSGKISSSKLLLRATHIKNLNFQPQQRDYIIANSIFHKISFFTLYNFQNNFTKHNLLYQIDFSQLNDSWINLYRMRKRYFLI